MSALTLDRRATPRVDRPTLQWEPARGSSPLTLRLFGSLGPKELHRIIDAILEAGRSPREVLCVDVEGVDHLDYRALAELTDALARIRNRGSFVWIVGLSDYARSLFHVAGQGAALGRLEWPGEAVLPRAPLRPAMEVVPEGTESIRLEAWSMAGL